MNNIIFKSKCWLKSFVFEQKCIPWRAYTTYCKIRNRIFNINTKKHWNVVWEREKNNPHPSRFYPVAFNKIISLVGFQKEVVDIGCGVGILLEKLKNEKKCKVFGVDISEKAIDVIKYKNMQGIVAKVPPIPLPLEFYDVVIATETLEHINNPRELILEMLRLTKPSGIVIITVPNNAIHPYSEREHVHTFNRKILDKILNNISEINKIDYWEVRELNEDFNRFVIRLEKSKKNE